MPGSPVDCRATAERGRCGTARVRPQPRCPCDVTGAGGSDSQPQAEDSIGGVIDGRVPALELG